MYKQSRFWHKSLGSYQNLPVSSGNALLGRATAKQYTLLGFSLSGGFNTIIRGNKACLIVYLILMLV